MAEFTVSAELFDTLLHDLWNCLNDSSQIAVDTELLDCLIKDRFEEPERNETAREFLIEAYKESLFQRATDLEDNLQSVLERLRKLQTPRTGRTDNRHPLSMSSTNPMTERFGGEVA